MHKNVFILPVSFTGSYTGDKPIWYNLILQKNVSDFLRLYEPCVVPSKFLLVAV